MTPLREKKFGRIWLIHAEQMSLYNFIGLIKTTDTAAD